MRVFVLYNCILFYYLELIKHHYGEKVLIKGWGDIKKSLKQYCLDLQKRVRNTLDEHDNDEEEEEEDEF